MRQHRPGRWRRFSQKYLSSLRAKMLMGFGSISIGILLIMCWVWLFGIPFTGYVGAYKEQESQVLNHLALMADLRKDRFELWLRERKGDAQSLATSVEISTGLAKLDEQVQNRYAGSEIRPRAWTDLAGEAQYHNIENRFRSFMNSYKTYSRVVAIGARTGLVVASDDSKNLGRNLAGKPYCTALLKLGHEEAVEVERDHSDGKLYLVVSHVVTRGFEPRNYEIVGVIALFIDVNDVVRPLLYAGTSPATAEDVVLVGSDAKLILPLKFPLADGTIAKPLEYELETAHTVLAARGKEGAVEAEDYRGVPVLAVYRHIRVSPEHGWGLVMKQDAAEAFAPVWRSLFAAWVTGLVAIFASAALLVVAARRIARPMEDLSEAAQRVQAGDLAIRIPPSGLCEAAVLGAAFNSMMDRLRDWHEDLEAQVQARTAELVEAGRRLTVEIEERKRAEQGLKESEERYRSIFNNAGVGIDLVDAEGRFLQVNNALAQMLGYSEDELLNLTIFDITLPGDIETSRRSYEEMVLGQTGSYRFDKRYIRKDGKVLWADVSVSAVRDRSGGHLATVGVIANITDRMRVDEALRESEEKYRMLVENAGEAIFVAQDGLLRFANAKSQEITGYTTEELTSRPFIEFIHPDDRERVLDGHVKVLRGVELTSKYPFRIVRAGGETRWVELRVVLIEWGGRAASLNFMSDVTTARKAEEIQRRLATAIEQAAEGVIITDSEGTIEYVNPAMEKMTEYCRDEMIGKTPRILKSGEHDEAFYGQLWETIKAGHIWSGSFINRKKGGRLYHEDATISPVKDTSGEIVNFVAVKRDITEHLELSKQLLQAQKMEATGTLAGGVAHDFNNILQVVLGYSELMMDDEGLSQRHRTDLKKIHQQASRGADLVRRLLTFSKKTETKPRPLNLNRSIKEMRKILERTISKMIDIRFFPADDLAAINADPSQMDQVLMNLALNARDAMPDGGKLDIETANVMLDEEYARTHLDAKPGRHVVLTVSDTGTGMDKKTLERIFEPFYTTKETGKGTGLGLAVVLGIVQQHGGHIRCYSKSGEGTTFKIYFPAVLPHVKPEETTAREIPRGGAETILLVDDEQMILDLCSRILTAAGYRVIAVSNGKQALEAYRAHGHEIDLVILDLIMPEMGGNECFEGLLSIDPAVKVVIASGYSATNPAKQTIAGGAKAFVSKPYDLRQVLKVVRETLDSE